jgi:hypothetical protein
MFQVFYVSFFYVATVAYGCFKSRSRVAHEMYVRSGWRHRRRVGRRRPAAGALARKPDALGARALAKRIPFDASVPDRMLGR